MDVHSNLTLSSDELLVIDKRGGPWVHGGHGLADSLHGSGLSTELVGRGLEESVAEARINGDTLDDLWKAFATPAWFSLSPRGLRRKSA